MDNESAGCEPANSGKSVEMIGCETILAELQQLSHEFRQLQAFLIAQSDARQRFIAAAEQVQAAVVSLHTLGNTHAGEPVPERYIRPSATDARQRQVTAFAHCCYIT